MAKAEQRQEIHKRFVQDDVKAGKLVVIVLTRQDRAKGAAGRRNAGCSGLRDTDHHDCAKVNAAPCALL